MKVLRSAEVGSLPEAKWQPALNCRGFHHLDTINSLTPLRMPERDTRSRHPSDKQTAVFESEAILSGDCACVTWLLDTLLVVLNTSVISKPLYLFIYLSIYLSKESQTVISHRDAPKHQTLVRIYQLPLLDEISEKQIWLMWSVEPWRYPELGLTPRLLVCSVGFCRCIHGGAAPELLLPGISFIQSQAAVALCRLIQMDCVTDCVTADFWLQTGNQACCKSTSQHSLLSVTWQRRSSPSLRGFHKSMRA